ncbi:MAG: hypothetical protein PHE50_03050 [Dehalococcoidales bacterium]|nr:hypothetical protein [Dehalococcoidales bacterium]
MTNTLHRLQRPGDPKDDYVVFTLASKGINDVDYLQKTRAFLETALKYNPVNVAGPTKYGPMYRPEKKLNPFTLYVRGRHEAVTPAELLEEVKYPGQALVVFDSKDKLEGFLKEIKALDMGLSVNVSSLVDDVREMAPRTGVKPHSINYALGFRGDLYQLPDRQVLGLTTMCGHGLISSNFAKKMVDAVKEKRITPEKAAGYLAKFCVCGAFNTTRAIRILKGDTNLPATVKNGKEKSNATP